MRPFGCLLFLLCAASSFAARKSAPPTRMLWVWYEDADLRFLKPAEAGVAWIAMTIFFDGARGVEPEPRRSRLLLAPGAYDVAVVRLEADSQFGGPRPAWTAEQRKSAVGSILDLLRITKSPALQIDFDAPQSAHLFYRNLLSDLRRQLDPRIFLSITAIPSWCGSRRSWIDDLPVDEIVPMIFDGGLIYSYRGVAMQTAPGELSDPACRNSIGLMIRPAWPLANTPTAAVRAGERVYFFNQAVWSRASVDEAFRRIPR